ncbi:GNAT family N-acetyltransferase [Chloroflexota bacterium]
MEITQCTKADFDQIITDIVDFWGHDRVKNLHNPVYLYEFGNTAYVVKEGEKVIGYLLGLFSQTEPVAYVKFIGVRQSHQKNGIARRLYEHFTEFARTKRCTELKAITSPTNLGSVAFHRSMGMQLLGQPNEEGIPVVRDYSGPGIDRIVFVKRI